MSLIIRKRLLAYLAFLGVIFTSGQCQSNITYQSSEMLERPVGLQVYALSGGMFQVTYYVQNAEATFDGYNLYISRESTGDNDTIPAYLHNGATPTFLHTPDEIDLINPVSVQISQFMDVRTDLSGNPVTSFVPFEAGTRYYFKLRAHSRFNVVSSPSNEVSAVALP